MTSNTSSASPVNNNEPTAPSTVTNNPAATNPTVNPTAKNSKTEEWDMASRIGSFQDLPPKLQKAMLEGIATNIINRMKAAQDHLKEISAQARRDSQG